MKNVCIIGVTGMLGSMVYAVLRRTYRLTIVYRDDHALNLLERAYGTIGRNRVIKYDFDLLYRQYLRGQIRADGLWEKIGEPDAVINCTGIITPHINSNVPLSFFINSALPHILSRRFQDRLIQVSSDCVFSGRVGAPYTEDSQTDPADLYGITKSLGEPQNRSLVFRTSIIGPELSGYHGLYEWFRHSTVPVYGYTHRIWNGITTRQFAGICDRIIGNRKEFPASGVYHIHSDALSKYEMLVKIKEKLGLPTDIIPSKARPIDRRLSSVRPLLQNLDIPSFDEMLKAL